MSPSRLPGKKIPLGEKTLLGILRTSPLAEDMNLDESHILCRFVTLRRLRPGDVLIESHTIGSQLYCVVDGMLSVDMADDLGETRENLNVLTVGNLAGEFGFLENVDRTATLKAVTETDVLGLSREDFLVLKRDHPELAFKILTTIIRSIRRILIQMNAQKMDLQAYIRRYI